MICDNCFHNEICMKLRTGFKDFIIIQRQLNKELNCEYFEDKAKIQNALEKQIPKKPLINSETYDNKDYHFWEIYHAYCPICKKLVFSFYNGKTGVNTEGKQTKFCGNCGQALDWSDKK